LAVYNNFEDYKEEIELSCAQNHGVEIELYSIIAAIIREYCPNISLRDVSTRRTIKDEDLELKGIGGFPDFVILERKLDAPNIYGCIEAKNTFEVFDAHVNQIEKHIKSFEKVIYTNGLEWRWFEGKNVEKWKITLGHREVVREGRRKKSLIVWEDLSSWEKLITRIKSINWN